MHSNQQGSQALTSIMTRMDGVCCQLKHCTCAGLGNHACSLSHNSSINCF